MPHSCSLYNEYPDDHWDNWMTDEEYYGEPREQDDDQSSSPQWTEQDELRCSQSPMLNNFRTFASNLDQVDTVVAGWFICVENGVESISSGGDSPLKALQSGRQKKRQEAFDAIIEKCITDEFGELVVEWGLQLNVELQETSGLYGIEIRVVDKDDVYLRVFLDAWNGAVSSGENDDVCFQFSAETGAKNVKALLEKERERSLEAFTV